jgi:hypothetical protein
MDTTRLTDCPLTLDFFFSLNNCEFLSDAYLASVEALAQGGLFRAHANFIHGLLFLSV